MTINGHGKLNAIGAAIARLPVLSDIEREAMEKMPIKDAMREVAKHLQADLEAALQTSVERFLGAPIVDPEIVRGRLNVILNEQDGDTYLMDGVPVLWAGPVKMVRHGDTMHGERKLRQLI